MENERFEFQNVGNIVMWYSWNGSFQLQCAANSKENGQKSWFKNKGGLRTQKQNDSKQIRVIIGLFPFRLLPAFFWKMNIMDALTANVIFFSSTLYTASLYKSFFA